MKNWTNKKIEGLDNDGDLSKFSIKRITANDNANSEASKKAAKLQGIKNTKNKFWEKTTFEDRSRGGKIAGKKRAQMQDFHDLQLKAGRNSAKKRIEKAVEKYKSILKFIRKKEFTYSDVKDACKKYGIITTSIDAQAKSILKQKSIVKQIHKGCNQFNPSIYIKINL